MLARSTRQSGCWQIDSTEWLLAGGAKVAIFQLIDDHSRLALASLVAEAETSKAAIRVVHIAIDRHGVPQKFLSDNGAAFNPKRRGHTGALVEYLTTSASCRSRKNALIALGGVAGEDVHRPGPDRRQPGTAGTQGSGWPPAGRGTPWS